MVGGLDAFTERALFPRLQQRHAGDLLKAEADRIELWAFARGFIIARRPREIRFFGEFPSLAR